jgi:hypothetical protein
MTVELTEAALTGPAQRLDFPTSSTNYRSGSDPWSVWWPICSTRWPPTAGSAILQRLADLGALLAHAEDQVRLGHQAVGASRADHVERALVPEPGTDR